MRARELELRELEAELVQEAIAGDAGAASLVAALKGYAPMDAPTHDGWRRERFEAELAELEPELRRLERIQRAAHEEGALRTGMEPELERLRRRVGLIRAELEELQADELAQNPTLQGWEADDPACRTIRRTP